jgi:uncharacterized membrane protein/YHS domain-containing protein
MTILGSVALIIVAAPALASDHPINEWCPVLTDQKADPEITTVYRGKTVAFCCDRCRAKFLADPEKYAGRLPQFADSPATMAGNTHEAREDEGHDMQRSDMVNHAARPAVPVERAEHHPDEGPVDLGDRRVPWLGRVHPVIVHFPLAGVPLALLGFLAWAVTGREAFAKADVPPLLVAALASIAAVITGNIAHDALRFSGALHEIVERHEFVSTTIMVLALCLSALRLWRWNRLTGRWRWVYGVGLSLTCMLLGITGYLGGSLVFGPDHLKF